MSLTPTTGDLANAAQKYFKLAEAEGRDLTTAERWEVERLIREAERLNGKGTHAIGYQLGAASTHTPTAPRRRRR